MILHRRWEGKERRKWKRERNGMGDAYPSGSDVMYTQIWRNSASSSLIWDSEVASSAFKETEEKKKKERKEEGRKVKKCQARNQKVVQMAHHRHRIELSIIKMTWSIDMIKCTMRWRRRGFKGKWSFFMKELSDSKARKNHKRVSWKSNHKCHAQTNAMKCDKLNQREKNEWCRYSKRHKKKNFPKGNENNFFIKIQSN